MGKTLSGISGQVPCKSHSFAQQAKLPVPHHQAAEGLFCLFDSFPPLLPCVPFFSPISICPVVLLFLLSFQTLLLKGFLPVWTSVGASASQQLVGPALLAGQAAPRARAAGQGAVGGLNPDQARFRAPSPWAVPEHGDALCTASALAGHRWPILWRFCVGKQTSSIPELQGKDLPFLKGF